MLAEKQLAEIATQNVHDIFGLDYLKSNREGSCMAYGMIDDNTYMLFVGIKGKEDLPNHKATQKGWTVYADVRVDARNGRIKSMDYQKE